jgi:predicted amidophosphoribosyltransferase
MRHQAAIIAPSTPEEKRHMVICPNCERNQSMAKNGLCRRCGWKLPSNHPDVDHSDSLLKSAAMAMQLSLGRYFGSNKEEPF